MRVQYICMNACIASTKMQKLKRRKKNTRKRRIWKRIKHLQCVYIQWLLFGAQNQCQYQLVLVSHCILVFLRLILANTHILFDCMCMKREKTSIAGKKKMKRKLFGVELSKPRLKLLNWYLVKYNSKHIQFGDAFWLMYNNKNEQKEYIQTWLRIN